MDDFETKIRALAARSSSSATLRWALEYIDGGRHVLGPDPLGMAEFAFEHAEIMRHCEDGKKINAIKLMRELTQIGLKEAKDAVEMAWAWKQDGRLTASQLADLEVEEQHAIESILGAR